MMILGEGGVGKSNALLRFTQDKFDERSISSMVEQGTKVISVEGKKVQVRVMEPAGKERFRPMDKSGFRGGPHGVMRS